MSSASALLAALDVRCSHDHAHQALVGGRASAAAVYPAALCMAILSGIGAQRPREGLGPPEPVRRAVNLGVGLYDLAPALHGDPMSVDPCVIQEHAKYEEEEEAY